MGPSAPPCGTSTDTPGPYVGLAEDLWTLWAPCGPAPATDSQHPLIPDSFVDQDIALWTSYGLLWPSYSLLWTC